MTKRKITTEQANQVFGTIAAREGVSVEKVKRDILFAMEVGMANPDPKVKSIWKSIPCGGEKPTPEEFLFGLWERCKLPLFRGVHRNKRGVQILNPFAHPLHTL